MSTALPATPARAALLRPWAAVYRAGLHVSALSARWADLGLPPAPPTSRLLTFGTTFRVCAVCLDEYAVGDRLRVLEPCNHCFHAACVDSWSRVAQRPACPVCVAPTSVPGEPAVPARCARERQHDEEEIIQLRRARVQLIDLSVHDSWIEWFSGLLKGRVPQERPPLSLALPAD